MSHTDFIAYLSLWLIGMILGFNFERLSGRFLGYTNTGKHTSSQRQRVGDDGKVSGEKTPGGNGDQQAGANQFQGEFLAGDIGKLGGSNVKTVPIKVDPLALYFGILFGYALLGGRVISHKGLTDGAQQLDVCVGAGDGGNGVVIHVVFPEKSGSVTA